LPESWELRRIQLPEKYNIIYIQVVESLSTHMQVSGVIVVNLRWHRPSEFIYKDCAYKPAAHERNLLSKPPRVAASSAMYFHRTRWENYSTTT
jgi:hypothetical protein